MRKLSTKASRTILGVQVLCIVYPFTLAPLFDQLFDRTSAVGDILAIKLSLLLPILSIFVGAYNFVKSGTSAVRWISFSLAVFLLIVNLFWLLLGMMSGWNGVLS